MSAADWLQIALYFAALLLLVRPLGAYMAAVYGGSPPRFAAWMRPIERGIYRLTGTRSDEGQNWKTYAIAMLLFNGAGFIAVYLLQRAQALLPLNPARMTAVSPDLSFNTAVSFATNTNWQSYGGETTLSYFTQMIGLTVQNFVSAATGMAILAALARGFIRKQVEDIGNFWVDLTRSTLYILLPLSFVFALVLVSQGVVQTFSNYHTVPLVQPTVASDGAKITEQTIAVGPAASQIAIKQLGTNGGGFFNVNSAHPLENPTPLSNFLQCLAILLIPAAFCYTFGRMIGDTRQGWALLAVMLCILVVALGVGLRAESSNHPEIAAILAGKSDGSTTIDRTANLEGKEVRFGAANSVLWSVVTTAASNGSVNSMHDSFTPLGGLVPMVMMQLGEVVFGGVGSGLYGLLVFAIVAVFISGLMVGRTPEYLGKKIEAFEMKMASIAILVPCFCVLIGTAAAVLLPQISASLANPLPHGFSEVLYAFSSAGNNNGSAFAGLGANNVPLNSLLGVAMLLGRYWIAIPVLAIAGSLAAKKHVPVSEGTLPTHTPLFVALLIGVVLIVGALTFVPALALGPIAEQMEIFAAVR